MSRDVKDGLLAVTLFLVIPFATLGFSMAVDAPWSSWPMYTYGIGLTLWMFYALFFEWSINVDGRVVEALISKQTWYSLIDWWDRVVTRKDEPSPISLVRGDPYEGIMESVRRMIPDRKPKKKYKPIKKLYVPSRDGKGLYARDKDGKPIAFGVQVHGKHFGHNDPVNEFEV